MPIAIIIAVIVVAVVFVIAVISGFKIIRQSEVMVIERLGRYHKTLTSGINIIWPFIDQTRKIKWRHIIHQARGTFIKQEEF